MTFRNPADNGPLLETMVFMQLRRRGYAVEYIQTKDGYETDFFARHKATGDVSLIQVCWNMTDQKTFKRELRGLQSAKAELSLDAGTIVTWDDESTLEGGVDIVPIWKWLLS